jgi:hypothetical protein
VEVECLNIEVDAVKLIDEEIVGLAVELYDADRVNE